MWVRRSPDKQQPQDDPDWVVQLAQFLDKNDNKEKLEEVRKIFIEAYLENVREGMKSEEALQKAKMIALSFFVLP
jgi:uncharacterized protein (DUF934 family)